MDASLNKESRAFIVNEKKFEENICDDIGTICGMLYPNCKLTYIKQEGEDHHYKINKIVDTDLLLKQIATCHLSCKAKRIEQMNTVELKVVKYMDNYYIVDGGKKIPLFD